MPNVRRYVTIVLIMVAVAIGLRVFFDVPTWFTLGVLLIGWPLLGTLVTLDDDLPGGWSNPDGKAVPEWRSTWWWADLILVRGSLVVLALAAERILQGQVPIAAFVTALLMALIGVPLLVRGVRRMSQMPANPSLERP